PLTYSDGPPAPAIFSATCSSNVLLPIPGSPPISVTEPATRPPPSIRSNSSIPVCRRVSASTSTLLIGIGTARTIPAAPPRKIFFPPPLTPVGTFSSTRLFHSPHAPHFPSQRGKLSPHSWQTNRTLSLVANVCPLLGDAPCRGFLQPLSTMT